MLLPLYLVIITLIAPSLCATTFSLPDDNGRVLGHNIIVYSYEGDTLLDISREFNIGYREIVNANPDLDPWLLGDEQEILVPNRFILPNSARKGIVINLAEMRLYYFPSRKEDQRQMVITHPIGVGRRGWATPLGKARIIQKKRDPTWTPSLSIHQEYIKKGEPLPTVVASGPGNPLGAYAMRLSMTGYLLHGTNKPYGVGLRVSHGCIRLFPEDIEHLFSIVPINTPVEILYQPYKAALQDDVLYVEAHEIQEDVDFRDGGNMTPMVAEIINIQNYVLFDNEWQFIEDLGHRHQGIVKIVNQRDIDVIENVWFIHGGMKINAAGRMVTALSILDYGEYFFPIRYGAMGEVLVGPFNNQKEAKHMALKIGKL